jgi:site-specific DNA recombinase
MSKKQAQRLRCAIYTRVSDERNLAPVFNSIEAQYEASSAYILSQSHEGWEAVAERYDDNGFSGGNINRPALRRLCRDVQLGRLDIIVVYKIDRLTRSLRDFVKLVQFLDRHHISFVSVTQPFNTATSLGRMLLNVLLSFAEYERELDSERIYDKIAASKRKGVWVGGPIALGYETHNGKVLINKDEAHQVRMIFNKYLELGTLQSAARISCRARHYCATASTQGRKPSSGISIHSFRTWIDAPQQILHWPGGVRG